MQLKYITWAVAFCLWLSLIKFRDGFKFCLEVGLKLLEPQCNRSVTTTLLFWPMKIFYILYEKRTLFNYIIITNCTRCHVFWIKKSIATAADFHQTCKYRAYIRRFKKFSHCDLFVEYYWIIHSIIVRITKMWNHMLLF